MSWTSMKMRIEEWGPMALCALLSLAAFYLLILQRAGVSEVILLAMMLVCPVIYFIAWLFGGSSRRGGPGIPREEKPDAAKEQEGWCHHPELLTPGEG